MTQLLLTYDFPPIGGGIARMTGELARRYPPGTLVVSTGSHPASAAADASIANVVDRVSIRSRRLRTLHGLLVWSHRAAALARAINPEFVWCGNFKPAGYPARWIRKRAGIPYGIIFYGTDLLLLQRQIQRSLTKRRTARALIGSASALVAISGWTQKLCHSVFGQLGFDSARMDVRTLSLGTDPEQFRPDIDSSVVRARYGLNGRRWLITVARLTRHKGIDIGLQAVAQLCRRYPDLAYLVVGSGGDLSRLQGLAHDLGVADRVCFLTDVPDRDLPGLYNSAEIYLGLSRQMEGNVEGFGISLVEAGACGIPVVGGRSGGIPDAVREGETGLLVDSERLDDVCSAISRLLDDRGAARRLGAGGRQAVETYYNWNRVADDLARLGHELGSSVRTEVRQ
ncbi:MAG TPA: glycosyltransferase family 4 protein [Gemmatimonadales bacterium]|nr:glycosyltransferase family 4 protein [Gemmatimonadales bacterium]